MSVQGKWVRSSRIGDSEALNNILAVIGPLRDALVASDTVANAAAIALEIASLVELLFQTISSRRAIGIGISQLLRDLLEPLLTDGAYLLTYSNLGSLIERTGVGPLISAQGIRVPVEEDAFTAGLYAEFPQRPYTYSGFVPNQVRQAAYQVQNLTENVEFREFDAWLAPVLEAFYDEGDRRRPKVNSSDKLAALLLTIEGVDPVSIYDQFLALQRLVSTPIPFVDMENLFSAQQADDDGTRSRRPRLRPIQDLGLYGVSRSKVISYSSRPDFARLTTADLLPPLGEALTGLMLGADIMGPNLPVFVSIDGLIGAILQVYGRILETLDRVVRAIQTVDDLLKLSGVSRLWVEFDTGGVDGLVSRIRQASSTRNDYVRVLSNGPGLDANGNVVPPEENTGVRFGALARGSLVRQNDARRWKADHPGFITGPAGDLIIMGVCMTFVEGPLAQLIQMLIPTEDDESESDGTGPSMVPEVIARRNARYFVQPASTPRISRRRPRSRSNRGADRGIGQRSSDGSSPRGPASSVGSESFDAPAPAAAVPGVGFSSRAGICPSADPVTRRVIYAADDVPSNWNWESETEIALHPKCVPSSGMTENWNLDLGYTYGFLPASGVGEQEESPPASTFAVTDSPRNAVTVGSNVQILPGGGRVESADLAAAMDEIGTGVIYAEGLVQWVNGKSSWVRVRLTRTSVPEVISVSPSLPSPPLTTGVFQSVIAVLGGPPSVSATASLSAGVGHTLAVAVDRVYETLSEDGDELLPDLVPARTCLQVSAAGVLYDADSADWAYEVSSSVVAEHGPVRTWPGESSWKPADNDLFFPIEANYIRDSLSLPSYQVANASGIGGSWSLLGVIAKTDFWVGLGTISATTVHVSSTTHNTLIQSAKLWVHTEDGWIAPEGVTHTSVNGIVSFSPAIISEYADFSAMLKVTASGDHSVSWHGMIASETERSQAASQLVFRYVPSQTGLFHLVKGEVPAGVSVFGSRQDPSIAISQVPLLRHPASNEPDGFKERAFQMCIRNPFGFDGNWRLATGLNWHLQGNVTGLHMTMTLQVASADPIVLTVPLDFTDTYLWIRIEFGPERPTLLGYGMSNQYTFEGYEDQVSDPQSFDLLAFPWGGGLVEVGLPESAEMLDSPEWESSGMRTGGIPVALIGVSAVIIEPS